MSYTELFQFGKTGEAEELGDVQNAWRGAHAVWRLLETKYLSPLPRPIWMSPEDYEKNGYSRTSVPPLREVNALKEIWDLWKNENVSRIDKIVLGTTFDNVIVLRDNIEETIKAFEEFEGETSLKEQSILLKEALHDKNVIAIAWNQTSVCADNWVNYKYDDEKEEEIPYNINTEKEHWNLFSELT
jgi:hypothetical protein